MYLTPTHALVLLTCKMHLLFAAPPVARIREVGVIRYPSECAWTYLAKNCPSTTALTSLNGRKGGTRESFGLK